MSARIGARNVIDPRGMSFRDLVEVVSPWRLLVAGAIVCVVASAVLSVVRPLVIGRLIDDHLTQGRQAGVWSLALLYLGASAGGYVTGFGTSYLMAVAAQGALRDLRIRLFAHLQELPIEYYDRTPLGDIISRCTADMDTISALFSSGLISVLAQALRLVGALIGMLALSPPLSAVMIVVLPVIYVLTRFFQVRMREAERAMRRAVGELNGRLQETLMGVEVIRAFRWEARFVQRFRRTLYETLLATDRSLAVGAMYSPLMNILSAAIVACLLWLGATRSSSTVTVGTLTAFVLLFLDFFEPLISIGNEWQSVQSALAGAERVFQVLHLPVDNLQQAQGAVGSGKLVPPTRDQAAVRTVVQVDGLSFGYVEAQPVLRGVSFSVLVGQHLAIVGRTGAGKSTLFHLLGGLYRPDVGRMLLAGRAPSSLAPRERRAILGAVPQTAQVFTGTVLENLTFGDSETPIEAAQRAASIAGADAFIRDLPHGYETMLVGEGRGEGAQLSGGQRQLLALARALVGDPDVLLLDEATASVDGVTEATFKAALRRHLCDRGGAVLTIAHRLSTAMEADRIIVLEDGRVVEEGTPEDLLAGGGRLASLWALENAGWEWRETAL